MVQRLHARFDNLLWMKLSEVARYWAAKELTAIERSGGMLDFRAPFACPDFTVRIETPANRVRLGDADLREVAGARQLAPGTWCRETDRVTICFALPKGASRIAFT